MWKGRTSLSSSDGPRASMIGTPALAADLVRSKVDVIVAWSGQATKAVQEATRTIPIVMSLVNEPVRWRTELGPCECGFKFWGCGTRRRSPGYGLAMSPV